MNGAEMRAVDNMAQIAHPAGLTESYKPFTFARHQELTTLAYLVKKFIDAKGGIKENEGCAFGRLVQEIIFLK